jgi:anaerobic selenocysteine-containing dehydrogenase
MKHGKSSNLSDLSKWSGINEFAPAKVSEITGVPVPVIEQLAKDFVSSRKPVAVAGKGGKGVSSSAGEIIAIQCLNKLVANFGKQGGVFVRMKSNPLGEPKYDAAAQQSLKTAKKAKGLDEFIKKSDNIEVLFINEANPVHKSVLGADMADKMKKIPLVISFMPLINDTAVYSDYIFPTLSSLEMPSLKGEPAAAPRFQSKHAGDVIIGIGKAIDGVKNSFPWTSFKDVMKLAAKPDIRNAGGFTLSTEILKNHFAELKKKMTDSAAEFDVAMIPYEIPVVGDGSGLALPYVLKSVDEYTMKFGKLVVQINPETAKKCGVCEGSTARIVSKRGKSAKVIVHLSKTIAPDVVAVPMGFGHEAYTAYGNDKGMNPRQIMSDVIDPETGTADWWYTRVKIS